MASATEVDPPVLPDSLLHHVQVITGHASKPPKRHGGIQSGSRSRSRSRSKSRSRSRSKSRASKFSNIVFFLKKCKIYTINL